MQRRTAAALIGCRPSRPPPRDGASLAAAPEPPACWGPASAMAAMGWVVGRRRGGPALLRGVLGAALDRACSSGATVRAPSAAAQVRRGAGGPAREGCEARPVRRRGVSKEVWGRGPVAGGRAPLPAGCPAGARPPGVEVRIWSPGPVQN